MSGVTDFHVHAFPDELAARATEKLARTLPGGAALDGTVGALLASMDRAGIGRSVVCSVATAPKQARPILEWSLSIRSERIEPFPSVHPACKDPAGEVARIARSGLLGVKFHAQHQGVAVDEPAMWPCYRAVAEHGLILVLHCGLDLTFPPDDERAHPARIRKVHERFADLRIVATHLGGYQRWEAAAEHLAGTDVYLETSFSLEVAPPEVLARILDRHDPNRILFGTDSPWRDQARDLRRAREFFADPDLQSRVLAENSDRLLRSVSVVDH